MGFYGNVFMCDRAYLLNGKIDMIKYDGFTCCGWFIIYFAVINFFSGVVVLFTQDAGGGIGQILASCVMAGLAYCFARRPVEVVPAAAPWPHGNPQYHPEPYDHHNQPGSYPPQNQPWFHAAPQYQPGSYVEGHLVQNIKGQEPSVHKTDPAKAPPDGAPSAPSGLPRGRNFFQGFNMNII